MQQVIKSIYEVVNEIVTPFKTLYPYQDIEADVDSGVVTFAPTKIKNITLSGESLQTDNNLMVDAVSEIFFEVDVYKAISWDSEIISSFDIAERLQIYLKSSKARDLFYNNYQYELMPIWSDITFQADFNTYKKWVQVAQFEISITKMSNIILEDKPLKNIKLEVNEVEILKNNQFYKSMNNRFLKTN